jgi:hypothetical protein
MTDPASSLRGEKTDEFAARGLARHRLPDAREVGYRTVRPV